MPGIRMLSLGPLAFAAPWLLVALAALPVLWWLLRVTPPTPRQVTFPAVRLLHDLPVAEETPARTPWWLLLLRTVAAALLILGLARPVLGPGRRRRRRRPAAARRGRWLGRRGGLARAHGRRRRPRSTAPGGRAARAALLATAPGETGEGPRVIGPMPAGDLRTRLAALRPKPWPPDHAAALAALETWRAANPGRLGLPGGVGRRGTHGAGRRFRRAAIGARRAPER